MDNQVRLQLFALAYNLGNFLRRLALPVGVKHWSLTTLREKLIKIGAKVVHHARSVVFRMAEVAIPRELFRLILTRIRRLRPTTAAAGRSRRPRKIWEMDGARVPVWSWGVENVSEASKWRRWLRQVLMNAMVVGQKMLVAGSWPRYLHQKLPRAVVGEVKSEIHLGNPG